MVSAENGDQSNTTPSVNGRTAPFAGGRPSGEESFAAPTLAIGQTGERIALEDAYVAEGTMFAGSHFIAEIVVK